MCTAQHERETESERVLYCEIRTAHNRKRTHYFHFFLRISSCMQHSSRIKTILLQTYILHTFCHPIALYLPRILLSLLFTFASVHLCQTFAMRRLSFLITSIYFHVFQQFYFSPFFPVCLFALCVSLRKFRSHTVSHSFCPAELLSDVVFVID